MLSIYAEFMKISKSVIFRWNLSLDMTVYYPFLFKSYFWRPSRIAAILKTFRHPKFSYSHLLYVLLACIYLNQASNLQGPILCKVNQTFIKYWSLDLRLMRVYVCVYTLISVPRTFISSNMTCIYFVCLFFFSVNWLRQFVKQFDLFL